MTTDEFVGTDPEAARARRRSARPLLLRLHFYAGVFIGPFLLVAALTGLLYIFTPQLEQVVYDHEMSVPAGSSAQPLESQLAAARQAVPDATVVRVRPGPEATDTTQVIFSRPDLEASHWLTAYVDPYSSEVRGVLETYGSSQATPVRTWIDQLHRGLHLGDFGRLYSELAASWLWVVVLGGLVLWWSKRRQHRVADRRAKGRRKLVSWHAATGSWVAIVLLFLSVTGLTWSQYAGESITDVRQALSWQTPTLSASMSEHAEHGGHAGHSEHSGSAPVTDAGPDRVLAAARAHGLDGRVELTLPKEGEVYLVKQIETGWPSKQDTVAIDPASAQVLETLRFDDYPLGAKLARWGIDAHMGMLFGLPNQLVLAVVCLALITMVVWGYRMWWHRRPTRDGFAMGKPFARGGWRSMPPAGLVALVVAGALAVWFLPVFGVTLIGFLVVDALLGLRESRVR
ncbi:PepSY-associated TM helix domain-containing protein [Amycolatopsis magusensis]|uniref:PepSY-associated TM helix domain-containing protein n=1 Tax=Amycolatopsis magusensis TaxID=882444 RepID=UPI0024A84085|nr:PepSY-associated TM helix domain-containing protein [Amycolatopsis magusensis]MDI5981672.1 PepSY-associated TM helix domain-containing protein [Amycolatopsis magusensis]